MSFKGALPQPDSRRSIRENGGTPVQLPTPERPMPPKGMKKPVRVIFDELVDRAIDAKVPTKALDARIFAMAATYQYDFDHVTDPGLSARIGRDLVKLHEEIGATPKARLRMGIKGKGKGDAQSTMGKLLGMAKITSAEPAT